MWQRVWSDCILCLPACLPHPTPPPARHGKLPAVSLLQCGQASTQALLQRIGSSPLRCTVRNKDQYGRSVASCAILEGDTSEDLGEWMVANGHAVAYRCAASMHAGAGASRQRWAAAPSLAVLRTRVSGQLPCACRAYSKRYVASEEAAQALGKGIWQGSFEAPAQWRRERRSSAGRSDRLTAQHQGFGGRSNSRSTVAAAPL